MVPLVALAAAFSVGALLIRSQGVNPAYAYESLFSYALLDGSGLTATLQKVVPLVLCGLAVAIPLRLGLFNIGGQGQFMVGAIGAAAAAYALRSAPGIVTIIVTMVVGVLAGSMWASIAGLLKAARGVHEVISTIMLNSVAGGLIDWMLNGPLADEQVPYPASHAVPGSAQLPPIGVVPIGLPVAVTLAVATAWLLRRTTIGFRFETVGRNRYAASYAGISIRTTTVVAMGIAGGCAGLSGGIELVGVEPYRYQDGIAASLGFDGITIALLARGNPIGTIPAALLVAAMRAGAPHLALDTGLRPEIVDMVLAITLLFVSLPLVVKLIFRKHAAKGSQLASSWGA
ncbi:ABC transporter permease [Kribbella turkmenica]|uniref:ABC transporter permease n=1 Tax=Kribbella turkmenica TaxID=2530375 RepID=UPI001405585B|nr:ABC transporter permease [Kribbella turkmenica]